MRVTNKAQKHRSAPFRGESFAFPASRQHEKFNSVELHAAPRVQAHRGPKRLASISKQTYYHWKDKYRSMQNGETNRLKQAGDNRDLKYVAPAHSPSDLRQIYEKRFAGKTEYRQRVWGVLCRYFGHWISPESCVLDLGCGHCEFINSIQAKRKFAMDLNPDSKTYAGPDVTVLEQNCAAQWNVAAASLNVIFSSNFFEHLPTKQDLEHTLDQAHAALVPGGNLIAMGPNIKYLPGEYWDFFDHYLPLTELSLSEVLTKCGFTIQLCHDRFLPYTMSHGREYPLWLLSMYLRLPTVWRYFGRQFLVIASKPR